MSAAAARPLVSRLDRVLARFVGARLVRENHWTALCAQCGDVLHLGINAASGRIILDCDRGCYFLEIAARAGLSPEDVCEPVPEEDAAIEQESGAASDSRSWPEPPSPAAFTGLAGDLVRLIEPHSEADPTALLTQALVSFGNIAGRGAHFVTDGSQQHLNENLLLCGPTAAGRKGTSWDQVRRVAVRVDPDWEARITSGLSSGEGLIASVRDAGGATGRGAGDSGVADKRLLVVEPEFASVLGVIRREGNVLSSRIRQAWETGTLNTMTRADPLRATNAHISVVGHITPSELLRLVTQVDVANGLLNRFLIIATRRSKYLPDGGAPSDADLREIVGILRTAVILARETGRMTRNEGARELWHAAYPSLVDRPGGLLGSATSRAAPHVVRLSCLYALLDGRRVIHRAHLESALAVWDYVERSTGFFLGESLGDPVADAILADLRASSNGIAKTELRHHAKDDTQAIDAALARLAAEGLAAAEKIPTKGRPREIWRAHNRLNTLNTFISSFPKDTAAPLRPVPNPPTVLLAKKAVKGEKGR